MRTRPSQICRHRSGPDSVQAPSHFSRQLSRRDWMRWSGISWTMLVACGSCVARLAGITGGANPAVRGANPVAPARCCGCRPLALALPTATAISRTAISPTARQHQGLILLPEEEVLKRNILRSTRCVESRHVVGSYGGAHGRHLGLGRGVRALADVQDLCVIRWPYQPLLNFLPDVGSGWRRRWWWWQWRWWR
jgi:hypothetical protein